MIIAIDIDEVLADHLSGVVKFHNKEYGTKLRREQFHSYNFWEVWDGTREDAIDKVHDYYKTSYFTNEKTIKGSKPAVARLKKKHKLIIITSRQDCIKKETREWIKKNFPYAFSKVVFTNSFSKKSAPRKKSDVCRRMKVDILIEDSLDHAKDCISDVKRIIILDQPWNQSSKLPKGIERAHSWKQIVDSI